MKKKRYRVWIARAGHDFIEVDATSAAGAKRAAVKKWKQTEGHPVILGCSEAGNPVDTSDTKPAL